MAWCPQTDHEEKLAMKPDHLVEDTKFRRWAVEHKEDGGPSPETVRKGYTFEKSSIDLERRSVTATISTGSIDRQGDTVDPLGWELDRYRENPVVLWAHDYRGLPIARATDVRVVGKGKKAKLKATAAFETFAFADAVFNLIVNGTLNATSVGFKPLAWKFADEEDPDRGFFAMDITQAELLEYSIVPVPANAEALIGAKGLEQVHRDALVRWSAEALEEGDEAGGLSRADLERIHKAWSSKGTYHLGSEASLDLAKNNILRISQDGQEHTIKLSGTGVTTINLGSGQTAVEPSELSPAPAPTPALASPKTTADAQTRLRRLRLDTYRRADASLH